MARIILSPADYIPVPLRCACMLEASGHLGNGAYGCGGRTLAINITPPAGDTTITFQSTGMIASGTQLDEGAARGEFLTIIVISPAGQAAVAFETARVLASSAHLYEGAARGVTLIIIIISPASQGAVVP